MDIFGQQIWPKKIINVVILVVNFIPKAIKNKQ